MAKKRRRINKRGVDIRPKGTHKRKPWNKLASSTKSYWRGKVDVRSVSERRKAPLDRLPENVRAYYTRTKFRTPRQRRLTLRNVVGERKLPKQPAKRREAFESLPPQQRAALESQLEGEPYGEFESIAELRDFRQEYIDLYGTDPLASMEEESVVTEQEDIYIYDPTFSPKRGYTYTGRE